MKKIILTLLIMTLSIVGFSQVQSRPMNRKTKIGNITLKNGTQIEMTFKTESCDCPGVKEGDENTVILKDTTMVNWFIYDLEQSIYTIEKRSNTTDSWYRSEFFGLKTNNLKDSIVFSSNENLVVKPVNLVKYDPDTEEMDINDFQAFTKGKPAIGSMMYAYFNGDAYEMQAGTYYDLNQFGFVLNDSSRITGMSKETDSTKMQYSEVEETSTIELVHGVTQIGIEDAKKIIAWLRKNKINQ